MTTSTAFRDTGEGLAPAGACLEELALRILQGDLLVGQLVAQILDSGLLQGVTRHENTKESDIIVVMSSWRCPLAALKKDSMGIQTESRPCNHGDACVLLSVHTAWRSKTESRPSFSDGKWRMAALGNFLTAVLSLLY